MTIQYTLMMSITSFLLTDEWNKTSGELAKGDEVTLYMASLRETRSTWTLIGLS